MSEWKMTKCEGCGAQILFSCRDDCEYCGRKIPWEEIIQALPAGYEVLYADHRPICIVYPDHG